MTLRSAAFFQVALLLSAVVVASKPNPTAVFGVTSSPDGIAGSTYDYIVIGGGTAGLAVAGRLSENPAISVLVVEAGADDRNNPLVYDVNQFTNVGGTYLDWGYLADEGRVVTQGKTLGGSSSINGGTWTRGSAAQYDSWSTLLEKSEANLGWNWKGMLHYMRKAENFFPPTPEQVAKGAEAIPSVHGSSGPVHAAFPRGMYGGPQQPAFLASASNASGLVHCPDFSAGNPNCVSMCPVSLNYFNNDRRSSSAEAYLTPNEKTRKNWVTLTQHLVTKIIWSNTQIPLVASGVEFATYTNTTNGTTRFTAHARKEVILAAGALRTPAILQLSGIGDADLLRPLNIAPLVDLKTVGLNLIDQTNTVLIASGTGFDPAGTGPSDVIAYPNFYQIFRNASTDKAAEVKKSIQAWAASQASNGLSASTLETIFEKQAEIILNTKAPMIEMFYATGPDPSIQLVTVCWQLLPFSRGRVAIVSNDPFKYPYVHANYLNVSLDLDVMAAGLQLARTILQTPPLSDLSTGEVVPGAAVPDNEEGGSAADWRAYIRQNYNSVTHPIGTAAMMRRELGGVVDGHLKVYDTANVRVVDASVLPMQLSAHLSSTVYGVAEKAADLIKAAQY
ncbi:glucose oxidase [Favolaschia claudopus]|uniref:Glucose oxidase n=1 Tax=Favolaschia claudopus TaxID=2862362 RepID=A0AAW0CJZ3_9AGAR